MVKAATQTAAGPCNCFTKQNRDAAYRIDRQPPLNF
jgi:hypothetical protein